MADLERTISIIFEGDDRSAAAFSQVSQGLGAVDTAVRSVTGPMAALADDVLKLEAGLSALALGGLTYAYVKSVEFESAMADLTKVVGADQVEALAAARQAAINLSETYGIASGVIVRSMADFVQSGYNLEESMLLAENAIKLTIAGEIDAAEATDLLKRTLQGFKAEASDSTRVIDILNEVSNNYGTSAVELARGMAELSPIAKQMGFSFEETAGVLVPVIEVFGSGTEAAIALKTGLLRLVDDSKPVQEALKALGISQTDANGALKSGKEIALEVAQAFTTLSAEEKLYYTQQLTGINQAGKMVEVFDGLSRSTEVTATAMKAAGSATQEVAVRLATAETQVKIFRAAFENMSIAVGDQFRVAVTQAISGATDIEKALSTMVNSGTFDPVFQLINEFADRLGRWLHEIAAAMPEAFAGVDWSGFTASISNLAEQAIRLFKGVFPEDLSTAEGLEKAIQKIINAWEWLNNVTSGIMSAWQPVFNAIGVLIQHLGDADSAVFKFGEKLGTMLGSAQILDALIDKFGLFGTILARTVIDAIDPAAESTADLNDTMHGLDYGMEETSLTLGERLVQAARNWTASAKAAKEESNALAEGVDQIPEDKKITIEPVGLAEAIKQIQQMGVDLSKVPLSKIVELSAATDQEAFDRVKEEIAAIPGAKRTDVSARSDPSVDEAADKIRKSFPPKKDVQVNALADIESIRGTERQIDALSRPRTSAVGVMADIESIRGTTLTIDAAAKDRTVKIDLDEKSVEYKIALLKEQFGLIQQSVEWKAKLDIAEVEANAQIVAALAGTLGSAFESSAQIITSAIDALSSWKPDQLTDLTGVRDFLMDTIERELDIRERAMEATERLVETQIEYMNAKMRAMADGEALIQIDGAGLQPHLEAFMWEVLSAIQTRVNEEGHAMLFGI